MKRLLILLAATAWLAAPGSAQAASCQTSGPTAGSYTATVCITAPADGAAVSGPVTVTATVAFAGTPPSGIQRVIFFLDGKYLLTDYSSPYTFTLPTGRFVDGARTLEAEALMRDAFTSAKAGISLSLANGVVAPPVNTNTFTPTGGTTPAAGQPFVLAAAGDGAGGEQSENNVVSLIKSWNPNLFLYLGDVYEKGSTSEFFNWYASAGEFGDLRSITDPTIGNHEYLSTPTAAGYFDYWDNVGHYFSVDAGGWHVVSIDSNGIFGQLTAGTPQYDWLANDLATRSLPCTLVYYHHPRWNIGQEGDDASMQDIWALMAQNGVDVVLNGHDHTYQRWQPLDGAGNAAPGGITEFVAGTGGHAVGSFVRQSSRVAASVVQFGALRLDLRPGGADWNFVATSGATLDSGALQCSGTATDTTPPSKPSSVTAGSPSFTEVDLSWAQSSDNVGIAGYDIYRDGTKIASTGLVGSYADRSVDPATSYQYTVVARDPAGNTSAPSDPASVTTQMQVAQFSDDFETGDLSKWTTASGMTVTGADHFGGLYAAEAATTGTAAYASKTLATPQSDLYYRTRFKVVSRAANPVNLLKLKTVGGGKLATLLLGSTGKLSYRNDQSAVTELSTTVPAPGVWHKLELHVVVRGAASLAEIWLDDVMLPDIGGADSFGTAQIGVLELGDSGGGRTFDVLFDNVRADVSAPADTSPPTAPGTLAATSASGPVAVLGWGAASDDQGVTGYDVFRNGTLVGSVAGAATTYTDATVAPHTSYSYQVRARDLAGHVSAFGNTAGVTIGAIVADGFESGGLSQWTSVSGLAVQGLQVFSGSFAARAASTGSPASAYVQLSAPASELYYRLRVKIVSKGANPVNLFRFRTPTGGAIGTVSVSSTGKLTFRDDVLALSTTSTTTIAAGRWYELQLHALANGASSVSEVWLDGVKIDALTRTDSLGTTPIGRVELGDPSTGRTFDVAFDDVAVDTAFLPETTPPTAPVGLTATSVSGTRIDLAWVAATDNVGVTGYTVYRNGLQIGTTSGATSYSDTTASPATAYTYTVTASDAAGNVSLPSTSAVATTLDSVPPTAPAGLTASVVSAGEIDLAWTASSDNVGVTGYDVYRNGSLIGSTAATVTAYADTTVQAATYSYAVRARDAAGNASDPSNGASVNMADASNTTGAVTFSDGFESGNLSLWSSVTGVVAQQQQVYAGAWGARATTSGDATFANETLASAQVEIYYRLRFKIVSQGANPVNVLKLRTSSASIVGVFLDSSDRLATRNDASAISTQSSTAVSVGSWHQLLLHAVINGASSLTEVWVDGVKVDALTKSDSLGTTPVSRIEIGDRTIGRTFDVAFDDVVVTTP